MVTNYPVTPSNPWLSIPKADASRARTVDEFLDLVSAEQERLGVEAGKFTWPEHLKPLVAAWMSSGEARPQGIAQEVPPFASSTSARATTRRRLVTKAISMAGAAGLFMLFGRNASAHHRCYFCGSTCRFNSFRGRYETVCNYSLTGSSCPESGCCTATYGGCVNCPGNACI